MNASAPQPSPPSTVARFLSLYITPTEEMLLPTEQMVEILSLRLEEVLPVPETSPLVVGVFNWRQQVVWLIDLPSVLGRLPLAQQSPGLLQRDVVVVNYQGQTLGLGITRVGKIYQGQAATELALPIVNVGTIVKMLT
jgi:chemotaxis signal transduction protein